MSGRRDNSSKSNEPFLFPDKHTSEFNVGAFNLQAAKNTAGQASRGTGYRVMV